MSAAPARPAAAPAGEVPQGDGIDVLGGIGEVLARKLTLGEFSITLGALTASLLTLATLWIVAAAIRRAVDRYAQRREAQRRVALYTVSRIFYYAIVVVAVFTALGVAGIPISRFAVLAGAIGVGLGFGLQAIFNNFLSGLILLFDRSLKVGDFVELESGVHGEVQDINIRYTRIRTNDNLDILVPNSEFVSGRVVNWTHREVSRRLHIPFGVAYGSDKELVKKAALEAAGDVAFTLTMDGARAPQVWLVGFGDSSLDFELVVWLNADATKRPSAVKAAYNWALETALAKYALAIPFPQRDLHLTSVFGLTREQALAAFARTDVDAGPDADKPAATLSERERRQLAKNDAQQDVERDIADSPPAPSNSDSAA